MDAPEPKPSGTVVVLRDAPHLEVLLLQRCPRDGKEGAWVFPGGKLERIDRVPGASDSDRARRAAVREAQEEAGLLLESDALVEIARWITPPVSPKRFDTWFFATAIEPDTEIQVDGDEMCGHGWQRPSDALAAHHAGERRLAPPTFVTVTWLDAFQQASQALETLPDRKPLPFRPRIQRIEEGACILYPGDAGYESDDHDAPGARHRLWTLKSGWRYERDD
ncbi:MAG: NUDIX hydrolase [Myxococcota bacterium]